MNDERVIIYHGGCADGASAAWLLDRHLDGPSTFHAGRYNDEPPYELCAGRDVWIVDFSYPGDQLAKLAEDAERFVMFDHHQTAVEHIALSGLETYPNIAEWAAHAPDHSEVCILDQSRSGVGIVAEWVAHVHGEPAPEFVHFLERRDLWQFDPDDPNDPTADVFAAVTSRELTPEVFDDINDMSIDELIFEGAAVNRWRNNLIGRVAASPFTMWLDKWEIATATCPYSIGSDVAGLLAERHGGIGAYVILHEADVQIGLRSRDDGPDVAKIAESYGGGGHKHASGLRLTWKQFAAATGNSPI